MRRVTALAMLVAAACGPPLGRVEQPHASDVAEAPATPERAMFSDVAHAAGVSRPDPTLAERGFRGLVAHGAAACDVDGDGDIDVFSAGLSSNALYLNRGDGAFDDVAAAAHVAVTGGPAGAPLFLDMDDDGDADLFLSGVGRQRLFENRLVPEGRLAFADVSARSGVDIDSAAFSVATGDVNGDGRPDLAIACYGAYGDVMPSSWCAADNGLPDLLLVNHGAGTFRNEARERGCADPRWGYSAVLADLDADADLDLLVANDFGGPNGCFVNDGGRFRDEARERGLGGIGYGMGLSLADPDRDGDLDLHVTNASSYVGERALAEGGIEPGTSLHRVVEGNKLFANAGGGRFSELAGAGHVLHGGWAWGGGFVDLDGDAWMDLYTPNGFLTGTTDEDTAGMFWQDVVTNHGDAGHDLRAFLVRQGARLVEGASFSGRERDLVMRNAGGRFVDVSSESGLDSESDGRAAVFADLDNDGDMDVFLRAMHGQAHYLFRNDVASEQGFVRIALRGTTSGRDAWGATVRVTWGGRTTAQAKLGGSGFMSQSDPRLLFNLGGAPSVERVDVTWPSGLRQSFPGVASGTSLLLVEGEDAPHVVEEHRFRLGGSGG